MGKPVIPGLYGIANTQCLVIHASDPDFFPESCSRFIQQCETYGFISTESVGLKAGFYLTGDHFLQQITFMGCSPYLKIYPDDEEDTSFCSVYIPESPSEASLICGKQTRPPVCSECKKPLRTDLTNLKYNDNIHCSSCQQLVRALDLDWRRNAGFVNFALVVSNIFPKEAIPTEALLIWLQQMTGCEWKYFYTDL